MEDSTLQQHNKQQMDRAHALLFELLNQALSVKSVKQVTIRIPSHGGKLGKPIAGVERE